MNIKQKNNRSKILEYESLVSFKRKGTWHFNNWSYVSHKIWELSQLKYTYTSREENL